MGPIIKHPMLNALYPLDVLVALTAQAQALPDIPALSHLRIARTVAPSIPCWPGRASGWQIRPKIGLTEDGVKMSTAG